MSPEQLRRQKEERLGETNVNSQGEVMTIINYRTAMDIDIQFSDTESIRCHQRYANFKKGAVKDYWLPTVYGVGRLENGKIYDENKEKRLPFKYWESMLKRCYNEPDLLRYPTYRSCKVCDEWLHFPSFEKWFNENYYECGEERMRLDKDILIKNNKIYSPDTAIFVPERINNFFTKTNARRGAYPIGVTYRPEEHKFVASMSKLDNEQHQTKHQIILGRFDNPEKAFIAYKKAKELYVKEIADIYLKKYPAFPIKLHTALYNYRVSITD